MSFSVEVAPQQDSSRTVGYVVIVTIDSHETVLTFLSKDHAEGFAQVERARLAEGEKVASQRVREIAYRLWEEEGCPQGDALRHWFAARTLFERDRGPQ
jgi:hypothetical protein